MRAVPKHSALCTVALTRVESQMDGVKKEPGELQTELTSIIKIKQLFKKPHIYLFYISNYVKVAETAGAQLDSWFVSLNFKLIRLQKNKIK